MPCRVMPIGMGSDATSLCLCVRNSSWQRRCNIFAPLREAFQISRKGAKARRRMNRVAGMMKERRDGYPIIA